MFGKIKARCAVIALAAIMLTLMVQASVAYYSTTGTATNIVTSGNIRMKILETTDQGTPFPDNGIYVIPGDVVGKAVSVENICDHPFYLRVKIVCGMDSQELSAEECFKLNINLKDWELHDGWYYYTGILQPGETTSYVFSQVEIVGSKVDTNYIGKTLKLSVKAQAVQSENNPVAEGKTYTAAGWPAE